MGKELKVTVGCDPEVFVSKVGHKTIVAAHGLVPGDKHDPHGILDGEGMVQVDGCALEFGIKPAETADEWYSRIKNTMNQLQLMIPGYNLQIVPTATFSEKAWENVPMVAKELGCEPDYNAWTGKVNPRPDVSKFPTMRSAGGHIHVGWCSGKDPMDKNHFDDCRLVAKQMDAYLGMFSLIWDPDNQRRGLYGKAGAFRPKPYGMEYRTLSNQWLKHDGLIDWVYYHTRKAVKDLAAGQSAEATYKDKIQKIIDENQTNWIITGEINYNMMSAYPNLPKYYTSRRGPLWKNENERVNP